MRKWFWCPLILLLIMNVIEAEQVKPVVYVMTHINDMEVNCQCGRNQLVRIFVTINLDKKPYMNSKRDFAELSKGRPWVKFDSLIEGINYRLDMEGN